MEIKVGRRKKVNKEFRNSWCPWSELALHRESRVRAKTRRAAVGWGGGCFPGTGCCSVCILHSKCGGGHCHHPILQGRLRPQCTCDLFRSHIQG